jgi:hypothetical protein
MIKGGLYLGIKLKNVLSYNTILENKKCIENQKNNR